MMARQIAARGRVCAGEGKRGAEVRPKFSVARIGTG